MWKYISGWTLVAMSHRNSTAQLLVISHAHHPCSGSLLHFFFFHSHNCLPRRPVSMLGVLANKTLDNVTLSSCWTVVDCNWLIKCKHLFRLFSHLTMPDIFSCAGTALRVWSVGSVERSTALRDFFFIARNTGVGRFFFVNLKSKTLLNDCYSFCPHAMSSPQRALIKRFIPFRLFWCFIQCRLVFLNWRLLRVFRGFLREEICPQCLELDQHS